MESTWTFLLDENVGRSVAEALARHGYAAGRGVDILEPGAADHTDVLPHARAHDRIIVTKD